MEKVKLFFIRILKKLFRFLIIFIPICINQFMLNKLVKEGIPGVINKLQTTIIIAIVNLIVSLSLSFSSIIKKLINYFVVDYNTNKISSIAIFYFIQFALVATLLLLNVLGKDNFSLLLDVLTMFGLLFTIILVVRINSKH